MTTVYCAGKELKVLMIGNSFSQSVLKYLPSIVEASADDHLLLGQAYIGGCSMQRHCAEYASSAQNPAHRPYWTNLELGHDHKASLQELLDARQWDMVTIQQASHESWRFERYADFYPQLVKIIRHHQPTAEIVVHQTWSYHSSDPRIAPPKPEWGFDQTGMYERLTESYRKLAQALNARIIPVGYAVQLTRARKAADAPDVVGNFYTVTDKETGKKREVRDCIHFNKRGEYLQGCVWYMYLFGRSGSDVKFRPQELTPEESGLYVKCAEDAVRDFPQIRTAAAE